LCVDKSRWTRPRRLSSSIPSHTWRLASTSTASCTEPGGYLQGGASDSFAQELAGFRKCETENASVLEAHHTRHAYLRNQTIHRACELRRWSNLHNATSPKKQYEISPPSNGVNLSPEEDLVECTPSREVCDEAHTSRVWLLAQGKQRHQIGVLSRLLQDTSLRLNISPLPEYQEDNLLV
jgi:hypothetical protein